MTDGRLGFVAQTHTGDVTPRRAIEQAGELGFDFVELYLDGASERTRIDLDELTALLDERGLDCTVHLPFVDLDLGSPRDLVRDGSVAELEACLEDAAGLGAEKAVLHASTHATPPEWDPATVKPRILDAVHDLDAVGRAVGVEVCVENLPGVLYSTTEIDEVLAETDASLTFDTGHARVDGFDEPDMAAFLRAHADRVSHVHVNDARVAADEHVPTGSGTIDFASALEPLREGWDGTYSLEIFTFDFDYLALAKSKFEAAMER